MWFSYFPIYTMIYLKEYKNLLIEQSALQHSHLSAASGLVKVGSWLYVIADDELHFGQFSLNDDHSKLHRCFEGELPLGYEQRKAEKPDLEVLTLLPKFHTDSPVLLALGSGSKKNRCRGAIITLDNINNIPVQTSIIDPSYFYSFLQEEIGELNIEGATVSGSQFFLFQRGNKENKLNATISLSLSDFYQILLSPNKRYRPTIHIKTYELGFIDQVPLGFTDATTLPNGNIVFTATAENTSDSYLDGQCMGSAIGIIDHKGNLILLEPVDKKVKLEGIEAEQIDNKIDLLVVTDADNAAQPAQLYKAELKIK